MFTVTFFVCNEGNVIGSLYGNGNVTVTGLCLNILPERSCKKTGSVASTTDENDRTGAVFDTH